MEISAPVKTRKLSLKERRCDRCGQVFMPTGTRSRYCSASCLRDGQIRPTKDLTGLRFGRLIVDQISTKRGPEKSRADAKNVLYQTYWLCVCDCGNVKRVAGGGLTSGRTRSCGCLHSETSRATGSVRGPERWNWKGGLNSYGYSNTWIDGKNVLVHRVVMEQMLGRPLLPDETVHHINGIRHDNRPENLELWSSRHPRGQRVDEKVAWAIDLLKLYAPERLK